MALRQLYTLELIALAGELQELKGFHIDKFYETKDDVFRLSLSRSGAKEEIICALPYAINKTSYIELTETPTNFAMAVRKRISGFVIGAVEQYSNDRIILMSLGKGEEQANLIFEMFGKGNLIVADSAMKILLAYKPHVFKDRTVRPGSAYLPPKNNNMGALDADSITAEVEKASSSGGETILSYLSKRIGIGTLYVEDSITRSGVDQKTKASALTQAQLASIAKCIIKEIKACADSMNAIIYKSPDGAADFAMCDIEKYSKYEKREFTSMQELLDLMYREAPQQPAEKSAEVEGLRQSIIKQKSTLDSIDEEITYNKNAGNTIFNSMQQINGIIGALRENRHMTKEDLQKLAKGIKILDVNLKDKTVTIEM